MGLSRPLPPPLPLALLQGGHLTWEALSNFQKCEPAVAEAAGYSCSVFLSRHPRTISMSVLVVVEMFNALNNLSENTNTTAMQVIGLVTSSACIYNCGSVGPTQRVPLNS